jgi:23S rRNA (adenine2503-C2)-methyltransferase
MASRNQAHRRGHSPNLYGLDRRELAGFLEPFGAPPFHAAQIYRWLYARASTDPGNWTDLPRSLRDAIAGVARADPGSLEESTQAADGTVKYLTRLPAGGSVECVYMRQSGRATLCISSQVGCALDCDFCLTGKMGFRRQLAPGEIAGQVSLLRQAHGLTERPFNLVFMGMGEPLHNYAAVTAAIRLLTDAEGFALSRQRITVSTAGLAPAIEKLATETVRPRLAVSLNATTDEVRDRLMPVNRKYPLARLLEACERFTEITGERVTFEYVLLHGINDSNEDVRRLTAIVRGARSKLNLIPFNPVPGQLAYSPPARERVLRIRERLLEQRVPVSVRWSRGAEARAACGQLALSGDGGSHDRPEG